MGVALGHVDRGVPEHLLYLLRAPRTAPPTGDERRGACVTEVVPPHRALDVGKLKVIFESVGLRFLTPAVARSREQEAPRVLGCVAREKLEPERAARHRNARL